MHLFLKSNDFVDQAGIYFKQKKLHLCSDVHTIGQVLYTSNNILLRSVSNDTSVILKFLNDLIPDDGTYIHLYGNVSFFKDIKNTSWLNFDEDLDLFGNVDIILNVMCWTDLIHGAAAAKLEKLLFKINYEILYVERPFDLYQLEDERQQLLVPNYDKHDVKEDLD